MPQHGSKSMQSAPGDPLAFLDLDLAWSGLETASARAGEAVTLISNERAPNVGASSSESNSAGPTTSRLSAPTGPLLPPDRWMSNSPYSTASLHLDRHAEGLVEMDSELARLSTKARILGQLLDATTKDMTEQLGIHRKALRAALSLAEEQTTNDIFRMAQRVSRAISWAVLVPVACTAAICLLIGLVTWAWTTYRIDLANAATVVAPHQSQRLQQAQTAVVEGRR